MNNHQNEPAKSKNGGTIKKTFSVSKEFAFIVPELEKMSNYSRFVCEAIAEKLERKRNPGKDVADALAQFVQLQSIISNSQAISSLIPNISGQTLIPPTGDFSSTPSHSMVQSTNSAHSSVSSTPSNNHSQSGLSLHHESFDPIETNESVEDTFIEDANQSIENPIEPVYSETIETTEITNVENTFQAETEDDNDTNIVEETIVESNTQPIESTSPDVDNSKQENQNENVQNTEVNKELTEKKKALANFYGLQI